MKKTLPLALLVIAAGISLSACTVTPPRVVVGGPAVVWAPVAPPPPRYEVIPVRPYPDAFWVNGYWHWDGREHRWQEGRWERRREHERWEEHRWEQGHDGRWYSRGGRWERD